MSKLICIDCDRNELRIVVGSSGLTGVAVDQCIAQPLEIPVEEDFLESEIFANALKSVLQQHGLKGGQAIVTIPRSSVELRTLQVPSTDTNELPDMVRFAAQRHFANAGDHWPIDFLVLNQTEEGTSEVLAASVNPSKIERIQKLLESSGVKLQQLVLRPMVASAVALLKRPELKESPALFVDRTGAEVDMAVVDGKHVVFMRSIRLDSELSPDQYGQTLANEVRRTLLSAVSQNTQLKVGQLLLWGTDAEWQNVGSILTEKLKLPVSTIDPLDLVDAKSLGSKVPESRGKFAAGIGGLLAPTYHKDLIDFAHPRKRVEKKPPVVKYALAGTAAALLIGLPIFSYYSKVAALNAEIEQLNEAIEANKPLVDAAKKKTAEWNKIQSFLNKDVNALEQLALISEKALPGEKVIFRDFDFDSSTEPLIRSKLVAAEQSNVSQLFDALRTDDYLVNNKPIAGNNVIPKGYPWTSELELRIEGYKAPDPLKQKVAPKSAEAASKDSVPADKPQAADPSPSTEPKAEALPAPTTETPATASAETAPPATDAPAKAEPAVEIKSEPAPQSPQLDAAKPEPTAEAVTLENDAKEIQ